MPTNYTGRIVIIVTALVIAIGAIFFPGSQLFDPHKTFLEKTNFHPGIDMVGGVSLIYQIQANPGTDTHGLAQSVMESLKKRVDPNGVRGLIWRPEGDTRLEIQMPLSAESGQVPVIREAFTKSQLELDALTVRDDAVIDAVEKMSGTARGQRLDQLAADSATRKVLFKEMVSTFDQLTVFNGNPDKLSPAVLATKIEPLREKYESLKSEIAATNVSSRDLQDALEQAGSDKPEQKAAGEKMLASLKQRVSDFPSAAKAMADFQEKFKAYDAVKATVTDATDLKRLLQGSGVLEFHILADEVTANPADLAAINARLQEPDGKGPAPQPNDTIRWMEVERTEEFDRPGAIPETHLWKGRHYVPVLVTPEASMTKASPVKWGLENSTQIQKPDGTRAVGFTFDKAGGNLFGELTTHWSNIAKAKSSGLQGRNARLAIVLDNKVISAPNINEPITGGSGEITGGSSGGFNNDELSYLISTLNAGSLPAQLSSEPISEQQLGSTIGADNLRKGLVACGFGLIVVAVFLVSYYYVAGIVAFIAVVMNLILILGLMVAFQATFTLPSIAGLVLTVGTAVDANVLIFERLREEQHRGLGLKMALRNSYDRAFTAIVDSNMTSAITSLFLYCFGSEEVKGFGLTLLIGIFFSLFTSLYVTKTIFGILIDKFDVKHLGSLPLTFPKWDKALKPNWDWMGKAWIFYSFSIVMIAIGLTLFAIKVNAGEMMDIEFASGTSAQFKLLQPMDIGEVRKLIDAETLKKPDDLPNPSVVAVGTDGLHYEVVTPLHDRLKVEPAVIEALKGHLDIQQASKFDNVGLDYTNPADKTALGEKTILPIKDANFSVDGFNPPLTTDQIGGVAIVLRNLTPPISVDEIKKRLDNDRLSASGESATAINYVVESPTPDAKTSFAVIIGWNPDIQYREKDDAALAAWEANIAGPLWKLTDGAITKQGSLEKETNFDPQVAGEMQADAIKALTFSIIVIMAYIWMRFGNVKYGTATVIALLHDTVFTLAAMGFAHYISRYWPNNFLEVEPFRINLTVVAGILTIMGYSMIDTIVVFDRIRENRGKYGHLDREVINRAINETLSRTLLTAGTTIMTVSFMYFLGGPGIHGFTFVLLVGILVGTYSSVAIAAPLLLWGSRKELAGDYRSPAGKLQSVTG